MPFVPDYISTSRIVPVVAAALSACLLFSAGCAPQVAPFVAGTHPTAADVPPGSAQLIRVHPDVWVHVSTQRLNSGAVFPSNGLVVRDGDELLLVDSAWGEEATSALLDTIALRIRLPVRRAIATHFHDDRLGGADVLARRGVRVYASPTTRRLARVAGNPVPSDSLPDLDQSGSAVSLGTIEVFYPGPGHTRDNLVVYVPSARVLFGGCAVHEASRTTAGNVADADLEAWAATVRTVRERYPDAMLVVPGHGVPGDLDLLGHTIALVRRHAKSE